MATWMTASLVAVVALLGCSDDEGSADELCAALAQADVTGLFADFDPTETESALDQLRTARVQLGQLHDAAPGEVRDDLQVEIDYVQALIEGLEQVPAGDPTAAAVEVQAVTDAHPDVQAAAEDLEAFAADHCSPAAPSG